MTAVLSSWRALVDSSVAACLVPAALALLLSGLDDLALDLVCLWAWWKRRLSRRAHRFDKPEPTSPVCVEKRIAIFVPLWHEHVVIAGMVEHNVAAIHYDNYHFFIGAYPNDEPTLETVRELESRFPNVHLAVCAHDGPTSKADCLNWIYQCMLLFEEHHEGRFEVVMTHDAEDLIHPQALSQVNAYATDYEMVQIPVLPLPTKLRELVHGIYCDEFAEWQIKDMPARQIMGSFIPSNGVGTGFTRGALEKLANADHNLVFEPGCLTEDYENGLRLHNLGCSQKFVPLATTRSEIVATREYFPRNMRSAIRQRTRWIMGIGLQSWERHGWRGSLPQLYWFWRDRKSLFGNPLSLFSNFLFLYGLLTWMWARLTGTPWTLAQYALHPWLLLGTLSIQAVQTSIRMACVGSLYGALFAVGVPLRTLCGNWINSVATVNAVIRYYKAKMLNRPLVWLKTDHAYPSRTALLGHKRKLGEILSGSGYISEAALEQALSTQPEGTRIGEYLVQRGDLTPEELYEALSLQQSLPAGRLEPWVISANVARALPLRVIRLWKVLPFRISAGSMYLASPEIPSDELNGVLREFTRLSLRFHLVTPENFQELAASLL